MILLTFYWKINGLIELLNYLEFVTNQFTNNIGWKNNVYSLFKKKYSENFPRILIQINQELDKLNI